jgi:trigger factor
VNYKIKLNEIKKKHLPELNDEFVKQINKEIHDIATFREAIAEELYKIKQLKQKEQMKEKIREHLLNRLPQFPLPKILVDNKFSSFYNEYKARAAFYKSPEGKESGLSITDLVEQEEDNLEEIKNKLYEEAKRAVRIYIILDAIGDKENILVEDKSLDNLKIDEAQLNILKDKIRMDKIMDFLITKNLKR